MKILVLTTKFGMGHMSSGKAIAQQIKQEDISNEVILLDPFDQISPRVSSQIYKFYEQFIAKGAYLFNAAYRFTNQDIEEHMLLYNFYNIILQHIVVPLFNKFHPDMIISTHPFTSLIGSVYKNYTQSYIPFITCITDLDPNRVWVYPNTDYYFVASLYTKEDMMSYGILEEKIVVTGIPVKGEFYEKDERDPAETGNVLIMGGGFGLLPMDTEFYCELQEISDYRFIVVTGKNKKLYDKIYNKYDNVEVLGYSNKISTLMDESDYIITKPGGISTFEAIYSELPLIVFKPFLEQEKYNSSFIQDRNIGEVLTNPMRFAKKDVDELAEILSDSNLRERRIKNIRKVKAELNPYAMGEMIRYTKETRERERMSLYYVS